MQIVKYGKWFLVFSGIVLLPGVISLIMYGLNLSIDFTGGSVIEYKLPDGLSRDEVTAGVKSLYESKGVTIKEIKPKGDTSFSVKTKELEVSKNEEVKSEITKQYPGVELQMFETVGPTIGAETARNSFVAIIIASVGILLYIAFAFRNIPKPYSSLRFGLSAIVAMLHDALIVVGIFSILGKVANIEVDVLFITALLTVIGFSVHDTIVVFDRIRENLKKLPSAWNFDQVINFSLVETLGRSISTSLTVVLTLLSLYVLGGESIKPFVLALLIGIISGTYSSIFTASPILMYWEMKKR